MDSRELSEWEAYERACGPMGFMYGNDALAAIHEQLQVLTVAVCASGGSSELPEVQEFPRARTMYKPAAEQESQSIDEFDRNFQ